MNQCAGKGHGPAIAVADPHLTTPREKDRPMQLTNTPARSELVALRSSPPAVRA